MSETVRLVRIHVDPGAPADPIDSTRCLEGAPLQALANQFSNARGNFHVGVWSSTDGCWNVCYTEDEFCYLMQGEAVITDATGTPTTVRAGEAFVIPAGFTGSWRTVGHACKLYAIYEEP
jgi:hypothetical protein